MHILYPKLIYAIMKFEIFLSKKLNSNVSKMVKTSTFTETMLKKVKKATLWIQMFLIILYIQKISHHQYMTHLLPTISMKTKKKLII